MINHYVTTVSGEESPGVLTSLSLVTRSYGGEWLTSKVIKTEGRFAAIMSVVIHSTKEADLKAILEEKFPGLIFVYSPVTRVVQKERKTLHVVVDCIDRPGLTGDLNNILANLDIGIDNMVCKRFAMEGIGDVFSAHLSLVVSEATEGEVIAAELVAMSEDVQVSVLE